ncbi:unnamed protein product [Acidithrix sp. C25]|nr:unnamed protein product [Acidithrix sp. C25]
MISHCFFFFPRLVKRCVLRLILFIFWRSDFRIFGTSMVEDGEV